MASTKIFPNIDTQMKHLNGHILCSIAIETAGINPTRDEILKICILPLDNFIKPGKAVLPFYCDIKPKYPEEINYKEATLSREDIMEVGLNGLDPLDAADRLQEWFDEFDLKENKKIIPLTHNWPSVRHYLITWLGYFNFLQVFESRQYRDLIGFAIHVNDRHNISGGIDYPFPKIDDSYISLQTKVLFHKNMDVMEKALKFAETYRRMIRMKFN